jgi:hypothetical protein
MATHHKKRTYCSVCEQRYSEVEVEIDQGAGVVQVVAVWCCSCSHPNSPCLDELEALPRLYRERLEAEAMREDERAVAERLKALPSTADQERPITPDDRERPITPEYLAVVAEQFMRNCFSPLDGEGRHGPDYSRTASLRQGQEHGAARRCGKNGMG